MTSLDWFFVIAGAVVLYGALDGFEREFMHWLYHEPVNWRVAGYRFALIVLAITVIERHASFV